jgi:hypothetical protein
MDQDPERDPKPPARLKQPPSGFSLASIILTPASSPPASAPAEKAGIAKVYKIECWVFDGVSLITASTGDTFTKDQITDWLKTPSPAMEDGMRPAAGLRIVCREQEDSMKWPFDKATFEAIQDALDLSKIYSYFNLPKSDACGKYLGIPGQY